MKVFVTSFNRASDGAISKLVQKMKDEDFWTDDYKEADYILAVGDREETFDFVLKRYRENKKIIHLWAGEISQGTHDEVYRHTMTLMSDIQLCTNKEARDRVKSLCKAVDKKYVTAIVGNIMLDNLEIDETSIPTKPYDLVLYNPPTTEGEERVKEELKTIEGILIKNYIWIEPNGDKYSDLVLPYINEKTLPRPKFLGLLKNCNRFITNSSCQDYEAKFLIDKKKIQGIGMRNILRESRFSNMEIPNASDNVMKVIRSLNEKDK